MPVVSLGHSCEPLSGTAAVIRGSAGRFPLLHCTRSGPLSPLGHLIQARREVLQSTLVFVVSSGQLGMADRNGGRCKGVGATNGCTPRGPLSSNQTCHSVVATPHIIPGWSLGRLPASTSLLLIFYCVRAWLMAAVIRPPIDRRLPPSRRVLLFRIYAAFQPNVSERANHCYALPRHLPLLLSFILRSNARRKVLRRHSSVFPNCAPEKCLLE